MLYWFSRVICIFIFKVLFRIKIIGKENIPKNGGFILASNHVSYLDPIAIGVACPRKLNFMARHDLFHKPLLGWLISHLQAFPVKRASADLSALKEAMRRVKKGQALILFPEGTRARNGISSDPQPGIGFLAAKLEVPIIPAFIKGTYEGLPKGANFIRPVRISVSFGRQISVERGLPYQKIASDIMDNIRRLAC